MDEHNQRVRLVGTMTLGPKGQVVVPADVREAMGVKPGDKLVALYVPHKKAIGFVSEAAMQTMIDHMGTHLGELRTQLTEDK